MGERFKDSYRIQSARLRNWDYGWNAPYFVTICTQRMDCYFGEIITTHSGVSTQSTTKMQLSAIGEIAKKYWVEIPHHFPFVELGEFIVMPNHVHGIIIIDKPNNDETPDAIGRDAINRVSTKPRVSTEPNNPFTEPRTQTGMNMETKSIGGITGNHNPMLHDNLSRIIRWYKGRVSYESHKIDVCFDWQPRFHDHIIRTDQSFKYISNYIQNNPLNWHDDKFYNGTAQT